MFFTSPHDGRHMETWLTWWGRPFRSFRRLLLDSGRSVPSGGAFMTNDEGRHLRASPEPQTVLMEWME